MVLFYFFLISQSQALFFTLEGNAEQCFDLYVGKKHEFWGGFVISGENDQNVYTKLASSKGKTQYESNDREGSFGLESVGDIHTLCFRSLDSSITIISFEFSSEDEIEEEKLTTEEGLIPLRDSLKKITRNLDIVYRNLNFYENREKIHRDLAERTCDKVLLGGIWKIVVIIGVCLSQIYILRNYFNNKDHSRV